jgi:SAM-dependent methyltransferase
MGVAAHLKIPLDEYDARIRTFIPGYEQILDAAAGTLRALDTLTPTVVDLGTGTGALAARVLDVIPRANLVAIDEDAGILAAARARLARIGAAASFVQDSFLAIPIPACDAVIASFALHHVHDGRRKAALYHECRAAVRTGGLLVSADCMTATDAALQRAEHETWRAHLRAAYTEQETDAYFDAWRKEDVYFPLAQELAWMRDAGFVPDVVLRAAPFAVVAARAM